jgi:hypothetical protein
MREESARMAKTSAKKAKKAKKAKTARKAGRKPANLKAPSWFKKLKAPEKKGFAAMFAAPDSCERVLLVRDGEEGSGTWRITFKKD